MSRSNRPGTIPGRCSDSCHSSRRGWSRTERAEAFSTASANSPVGTDAGGGKIVKRFAVNAVNRPGLTGSPTSEMDRHRAATKLLTTCAQRADLEPSASSGSSVDKPRALVNRPRESIGTRGQIPSSISSLFLAHHPTCPLRGKQHLSKSGDCVRPTALHTGGGWYATRTTGIL